MTATRSPTRTRVQQPITPDIHPAWLNIIRRLQSVARSDNRGLAILTIKVLVDADGKPCRLWGDPLVVKLEPCDSAESEIERILNGYSKEERRMILAALIESLGRER